MADTVDLDRIEEFHEPAGELQTKVVRLAELIAGARSVVAFTGAGISASAGIPTFRGPDGCWTRQAQGRAPPACPALESVSPTATHMSLVQLEAEGKLSMVVSQNVDGLHLRSGLPGAKLAELHGNSYLEVCWGCDRRTLHERTMGGSSRRACADCRARVPVFCHCTGRACEGCGAACKDSVIHFGEPLPDADLRRAEQAAKRCDVMLVLGSSLTVSPANDVPAMARRRGAALVIVNLQETDMDADADLRIFAETDAVMTGVMRLLRSGSGGVVIGNRHALKPNGDETWHEWTAFVDVAGQEEQVAAVTFDLHPTFSPASVTVTEAPFEVTRLGWGTFDVGVRVQFKDGPELRHTHRLSFEGEGAWGAVGPS